jgi:hypothetical protein
MIGARVALWLVGLVVAAGCASAHYVPVKADGTLTSPYRAFFEQYRADMSDLPPACKAERDPLKTPEEVTERISEIPTRLTLPSDCDRELLVTAADKLVADHRGKILEFLGRP